ncbi:MAG: Hsp33 family molecular chaperone HslO [Solobacterium sp.]|nr:Hsp33 family molecular chaperone HslO [Solobacterium sp.]
MRDRLIIADALEGTVRIRAARTTDLVENARKAHNAQPTSCAALGRVLTIDAIMASEMKDESAKTVVTINGDGPAGTIVAQADGAGNVRGFIGDPSLYIFNHETGKLDVGAAVGHSGTLSVSKDLGLKEPFTGMVNLYSGEIGEDFTYYFALSEQTPSMVAVGVLVDRDCSVRAAGGMVVQLLPDAPEETIAFVESIQQRMRPVSTYIDEGYSPEEIIHELFPDARILGERELRWHCSCSKEGFAAALSLIQEKDLEEMIAEDHQAQITCQYCGKTYVFNEEELKEILEKHRHVEDRKRFPA